MRKPWVQHNARALFIESMLSDLRKFIELFLEIRSKKGSRSAFGDKFDIKRFKSIDNINILQEYAENFLEFLGRGSSRTAFVLSNRYALKIARNQKGVAQNEAEIDVYTNPKTQSVIAKVYDYDPENKWLIAEVVRPIEDPNEFEKLVGCTTSEFAHAVKVGKRTKSLESVPENVRNNKLVKAAINITLTNNLGVGDVIKPDHWGKTPDGRLVLLDYGFTEEVWDKHYSEKSEPQKQEVPNDQDAPTNAGGKPPAKSQKQPQPNNDRDAPTNAGGRPQQKKTNQPVDDRDAPTRDDRKVA